MKNENAKLNELKKQVMETVFNANVKAAGDLFKAVEDVFKSYNQTEKKEAKFRPLTIDYLMHDICRRNKMSEKQLLEFMNTASDIHPMAALTILIRAAAIIWNRRHTDEITQYDKVFVISTLDFRITEVPMEAVVSLATISPFRTFEEANEVQTLLQPLFDNIANPDTSNAQ